MRAYSYTVPSRTAFLTSALMVLFTAILFVASLPAAAAPGALIAKTLTAIPGGNNFLHRAAVQADGKIVVAGNARFGTMQFQITRYNTNGSLDTTFGKNGTVLEWLGPGNADAWALAIQPDGKIVVAGHARSDKDRFGIARFNADGTLDLSFGGGGVVTPAGPGDSGGFAMAIQSNGQILLGGYSLNSGGTKVFTVVRYNLNTTTLDTSFGTGGVAALAAGAGDEIIRSMAIQSDGRIVVAGSGNGYMRMARLNANGTVDGTWTTSTVTTLLGGNDMTILSGGQILIAGQVPGGTPRLGVIRMTSAGAVDTTFGSGGVAAVTAGTSATAYGLAVQPDGRIAVSGTATVGGNGAIAMGRFNANGTVDTSFGASGAATASVSSQDAGFGLALRGDGTFVVAGQTAGAHGDFDSLAIAFTSAGAVNTAFNGTGRSALDIGSMTASAQGSALQSDGKVVVVGSTQTENNGGGSTLGGMLARYNADATIDTSFGTGGVTLFSWPANAVAIQADGRIVVGGYSFTGSTRTMTFGRFTTAGAVDGTFGSGGTTTIAPATNDEVINTVAVQGDGKIVGAGSVLPGGVFSDSVFVRLTTAGGLDGTFNGSGKSVIAMSSGTETINSIAIQGDGKIVGAGWADVSGSQESITVTRVNANGTLDTAFGTGGVTSVNYATHSSFGFAAVIQPDGKIAVAGKMFNGTTDDFAIARLTASGGLDGTFGTGGMVSSDFGNHNRLFALALLPSGKFAGAGEDGGLFGLVQYLSNGSVDTAFGTNGNTAIQVNAGADFANALSVGLDGSLFASGNASGVFGIIRVAGDTTPTKATPTVSLVSSLNPSTGGQTITLTASVSGSAGTATGTVAFLNGTADITGCGSVALSSGVASCTTNSLPQGSNVLTASYSGNASYNSATSATLTQVVNAPPAGFSVTVALAGTGTGTVTSSPAGINCGATCSATFNAGTTVTLTATPAAGATFTGWSGACTGTGTCTASAAATVTATFDTTTNPPRLGNISTRGDVLTGDNVLIGGFIIGGTTPKTVMVVATGPSLANFGIANPLPNPMLTLVRSSDQSTIATNDDWQNSPNAAQMRATGFAPANPLESAILVTLPPGAYTAIMSGVGGTTGVGVVAVFEVDHPEVPLMNISTRGTVLTGDNVLIAGLIIQGNASQTVVISATGPSLARFGVSGVLANPTLTLVRSSDQSVIATNDDWQSAPNAAQIQASGFAPSDPRESAIMVTLPPGAYTAIVSGAGGGTGVAVVGVFKAQ